MRLGNILAQQGGVVETGRIVKFQIRQRGKGGVTSRKWCEAAILPLSEEERTAALSTALVYCREHPESELASEQHIRLAQKYLHNPDNLAEKFCTEAEIPMLRNGIAEEQLVFLQRQYAVHIQEEYPELLPPSTQEELESQIAALQKRLASLTEQAAGE